MSDDNTTTPPAGQPPLPPSGSDIRPISISEEMRRSYLDYAMSVIVSRALPDVRDGLKPVHRRILYSMYENGYDWNKPYRKSARVVGDVIGKYHPHGDQSIYDALVRMAQEFSMRLPLMDGQGNFGSVDGDPPAAMRYTEIRQARSRPRSSTISTRTRSTSRTITTTRNGSRRSCRPSSRTSWSTARAALPSAWRPTSLRTISARVCDATIALLEKPEMDVEELIEIVPGPDFPTGGIILGRSGIHAAYRTGRGSVVMRGVVATETIRKDREGLVITEIPYQVNKATMIEKIAELVKEKRIEGISDVRDESDRHGMRVVIELKRDAMADVVLNQLYRFTTLQTSFGCNIVALNGGRPELMALKDILKAFIGFRGTVITRRTKHLLNRARDRAHVLVGLAIAVANIDEVIALIRSSPDAATAREALMAKDWPAGDMAPLVQLIDDPRHTLTAVNTLRLSEAQARAILDLRLQRLTALGRDEVGDELKTLGGRISDYLDILSSRARVQQIIKDELEAVRDEFATPRRSQITESLGDFEDEDLIQREDMVVTVSHTGYVKRVPLDTYRAQRRGGKGRSGMQTRDEDFVTRLFVASTHAEVLFFSSRGMVYKMKVWRLPVGGPNSRGKAMVNLLPLEQNERITTILPLPEDNAERDSLHLMFATREGTVRRNELSDFVQVNRNGKIAMKLEESGDAIVGVQICRPDDDVLLNTAKGQAIRFPVEDVRVFKGRGSMGVRGIRLGKGDSVIALSIVRHVDASPSERLAYLKRAAAMRRAMGDEVEEPIAEVEEGVEAADLSQERYAELGAAEQFILTLSENGYGKRSSSYEYRVAGRGGKGIVGIATTKRNGDVVASFPVEDSDQIMLVTNGGKLIRTTVDEIRIAGRSTQGVTVFNTAANEQVVSVERLSEEPEDPEEQADPA